MSTAGYGYGYIAYMDLDAARKIAVHRDDENTCLLPDTDPVILPTGIRMQREK